ncbi:hypothetical protein [Deinococcus sp. AB2017081]|uniref:hypothetical protein n=1 Tax=Deinococcus sp. AB2017081 TaxID=3093660 RepID=UPI002ACC1B36|nr:hypothetical protein [Deinococcus sp. AB2017081]WQE94069.1 hypothetical protein U2P90_11680 [Deinococcus sp. AB2017081]
MTPPAIRGLTLRHPWPRLFLLDDGPKRVENRDWAPPAAMVGQLLALHGGLPPKPGDHAYLTEIRQALTWVGDIFDDPDPVDVFSDDDLLQEFCVPGIYGVARLADVVTSSDDPWFTGPFGWVLEDFVPIDPPLVDRSPSHRGLWVIEAGTLAGLRHRYLAATRPSAPAIDAGLDILGRVVARRPLCAADGDAVRALIAHGHLHVTPEFDRTDPCPYRLTETGRRALAQGARQP